jgi:hypothetical protein
MKNRDSNQKVTQNKFSSGSLHKESKKDHPLRLDKGSQHQLDLNGDSESATEF